MASKLACVITTNATGAFLTDFESSFRVSSAHLIVVGDLNTPASCKEQVRKFGEEVTEAIFLDVEDQCLFLEKFPKLDAHVPYKSDARRNVGFLWALTKGFDVILSMDDDNFPGDGFLASHMRTGQVQSLTSTEQSGCWFNCMSLLESVTPSRDRVEVYPRGFPHRRRFDDHSRVGSCVRAGRVGVTAGLWLGDPDVDAATRLSIQPFSKRLKSETVALAAGVRCPINTQNTSLVREAVCAYFYPAVKAPIFGMRVHRFGDILSGLFLQMCAESVGDLVSFGHPLTVQRRNPHDVLQDLRGELPGMILLEWMTRFFEDPLPASCSYSSAYHHLIERLEALGKTCANTAPDGTSAFLSELTLGMRAWHQACTAATSS